MMFKEFPGSRNPSRVMPGVQTSEDQTAEARLPVLFSSPASNLARLWIYALGNGRITACFGGTGLRVASRGIAILAPGLKRSE